MPKCPNCGTIYSDYDEYEGKCPYCGYNVQSGEEPSQQTQQGRQPAKQPRQGQLQRQPPQPQPPPQQGPQQGQLQYYSKDIDISGSLSKAFDILTNNLGAVLIYWLIPIIITIAISSFSNWYASTTMSGLTGGQYTDPSVILDEVITLLLITIPLSLANFVIYILFSGGLVGMAKEAYETGKTDMSTGLDFIKKNPIGLIGASVLLTIVVSLGFMLCLVPGCLFCYWWLFTIPVLLIEGKGITDSLSASKDFAKKNETLGFTIVLILLVIVLSFVGGAIGSAVGWFIPSTFVTQVLITPIVRGIIQLLVTSLAVIAITVHYLRGRPLSAKQYRYDQQGPQQYRPPAPPAR